MRPLLFVVLLALLVARPARADEVAPELEPTDLRVIAQAELRRLFVRLTTSEQQRLRGTYVAFDANVADPSAQIACDDDGDHVIVVTDALLRLATHLARGAAQGENARGIEDYATFLARTQRPGRRLLTPPPGFFDLPAAGTDDRLADVLSFVLARELVRLRAGDLACPAPTATKEAGDDTWTAAEARAATVVAARLYPHGGSDDEARERVHAAGRTEAGAKALERFFSELDRAHPLPAIVPTYRRFHREA